MLWLCGLCGRRRRWRSCEDAKLRDGVCLHALGDFLDVGFSSFLFFMNAWTPGFLTPMQQLKIMRALLF